MKIKNEKNEKIKKKKHKIKKNKKSKTKLSIALIHCDLIKKIKL